MGGGSPDDGSAQSVYVACTSFLTRAVLHFVVTTSAASKTQLTVSSILLFAGWSFPRVHVIPAVNDSGCR